MQRTGGVIPYRLIYSLGEHPYLGYLLEPHIVWLNANGSLSLSYKRVFSNTVEEFADALEADDYKIIKLLDEIEQTHVIKRFHKKAIRPTDYFTRIFDQKIYDYIRPKLEEKMLKALALIGNKPLYAMSKRDGYPAEERIHIAEEPTSILFHFRRTAEETRYFPTLKYKGQRLEFMYQQAEVVIDRQAWLLLNNTLYHFDEPLEGRKLTPFLQKRYISVGKKTERKYFETFVTGLIEKHHVYAEGFTIKTIQEEATPRLTLQSLDKQARLSLNFDYGAYSLPAGSETKVSVSLQYDAEQDHYTFLRIRRSLAWEDKQVRYLEALGLTKGAQLYSDFVLENTDPASYIDWLNRHQQALESQNFIIDQQVGDKQYFIGTTSMDIEVVEENDWFDVRAFALFGAFKIPFLQLREHILNRIKEFVLPNGNTAIIPEEWFAQYEHLFHFAIKRGELKLHKSHIGLLHEISEHTALTMSRKIAKLSDFDEIAQVDLPQHFSGELRPYQQAGYNWFHFLQEYQFGGVLADDMGLGKTVQTLALLQRRKEILQASDEARTSLLILPTSLVYNWVIEAA